MDPLFVLVQFFYRYFPQRMSISEDFVNCTTRIPSGIWSRLYGWLLWMCVLRIGSFPSALNTMVKSLTLNPYMSLFNLKLCTHIWSTNINFRPLPPYIGLFGPSRSYGWIWWEWGVDWASDIFFLSRTSTWLLKSRAQLIKRRLVLHIRSRISTGRRRSPKTFNSSNFWSRL